MIPCMVVPILNRPDLMARMLASVDEPVERLVIVDQTKEEWSVVCEQAQSQQIIKPILNLGYPGACNAGISQTPEAPWWLFASVDLVFGPGDLAAVVALIEKDAAPRCVTGDRTDERYLRGAYGAVNLAAIEAVGLFDEWAFYPGYFDDDDWERRCHLGGVDWVEYNGSIIHDRSSTIRSDPQCSARNAQTYPLNRERYVQKWGGNPGSETYETPYGLPVPLCFTRPDLAGRAARKW